MIIPNLLKPGDKVGILAPARKINAEDVENAAKILESWGLEVELSKNIFAQSHSYLSGADHQRLADFQQMVDDKNIKAIICARGGYGSTRILDNLDFTELKRNPKWIVGFSDVTAVHLRLLKEGLASIHAIMPVLFSKPDSTLSLVSLKSCLMKGECKIEAVATSLNRNGRSRGQVVGGNLSLIVDSFGTATEPDMKGKILVIEEIDEPLYKIDRMMTQLRRAGKLSELTGLIVGHMTDIRDTELKFGETVEQIIANAVRDCSYPVAFHFPSGHENPNLAWLHGAEATLDVTPARVILAFSPYDQKAYSKSA